MKRFILLLSSVLMLLALFSCRPPEIESAFVDFNAGRYDDALKSALDATEKYPQNSEAWYILGELYGKKNQIKKMKDAFDQSLAIDNKFAQKINVANTYYYQTSFNQGVNYYNAFQKFEDRDSPEARETLKKAIGNFENASYLEKDYNSSNLIAISYYLLNDQENARMAYEELTTLFPDSANAWVGLGDHYFYKNEYGKAVEYFKKALELDPNHAEAITNLSQSYDQLKDTENAIKTYKRAMEINPNEVAFPFNLALIYLKNANVEEVSEEDKAEYLKESANYFGKATEIDPDMTQAYELQSTALIQLQRFEEAKSILTEVLERHPQEGALWFNLGVCHGQLGNKDEADNAFNRAKDLGYE